MPEQEQYEKTALLEMRNITKKFGAVKAVDNISLTLAAGEAGDP